MPDEQKQPAPGHQFGTTMRIDLSPEMIEAVRRRKGPSESKRRTQPMICIPKPRAVTATGGADFQQLLQNIYDAAIITDIDGAIAMVNVRANQFFLAEPGQL